MALFTVWGAAAPTTAAVTSISTGAVIKTLLQLAPKSGVDLVVVEWGISFDGTAVATPGTVELIETDVAATVTASVAADIVKYGDPGGVAADTALITLGIAATGYNASAEGAITSTRLLDAQRISPTNQYVKQFPLGREPHLLNGKFTRVRVTFGTNVNALPYIIFGPAQ